VRTRKTEFLNVMVLLRGEWSGTGRLTPGRGLLQRKSKECDEGREDCDLPPSIEYSQDRSVSSEKGRTYKSRTVFNYQPKLFLNRRFKLTNNRQFLYFSE
jgi:hypothetical protein